MTTNFFLWMTDIIVDINTPEEFIESSEINTKKETSNIIRDSKGSREDYRQE